MPRPIRLLDRLIRRYGTTTYLCALLFAAIALWVVIPSRAQTATEEFRLKAAEDSLRSTVATLADHEHRLTVLTDHQEAMLKELDEISAYGKWLVLGVLGLVGITAWEKFISPKRGGGDSDSSGAVPLYRRKLVEAGERLGERLGERK